MWGQKEEADLQSEVPASPAVQHNPPGQPRKPVESWAAKASQQAADRGSRIGKTMQLKGKLLGDEDLQVDGVLEGKVELRDSYFRVGQSGKVHANVKARSIVIEGTLQGDLEVTEKIEIRKTGSLEGDVVTACISIEEGALFRGSVEIVRRKQVSAEPGPAKKPVAKDTTAKAGSKESEAGRAAAGEK